ncbi:MAG: pseudouridine synthase [Xanthomonadales bacterium]|nr:pseudouridine synthase [Xanthomonadales bacterium]
MKLLRRVANLGYGSRKQVLALFRQGRITDAGGQVLYADDDVDPQGVRLDGEPLDPPPPLTLVLNKPVGVVCSTRGPGPLVHSLFPPRFALRSPALASVGRLDRETGGLLLLTDDGQLLHRIISPRANVEKLYEAELAEDLRGDEGDLFASGTLLLEGETRPLAPACMLALGPRRARLVLTEGRYHQVRRMFAATGNHVVGLNRLAIGALEMDGLAPGQWRVACGNDLDALFRPCATTAACPGGTVLPAP